MQYTIIKKGITTTLYKVRDDKKSVICSVITTKQDRLLVVSATGYVFKGRGLRLKKVGHDYISSVTSDVRVLKAPHSATFHNERLKCNRLRYWLGDKNDSDRVILDDDRLFNNMLESIAVI